MDESMIGCAATDAPSQRRDPAADVSLRRRNVRLNVGVISGELDAVLVLDEAEHRADVPQVRRARDQLEVIAAVNERNVGHANPRGAPLMTEEEPPLFGIDLDAESGVESVVELARRRLI